MRLNHLNLVVDALAASCQFFSEYFGFRVVYEPGPGLTVLSGTDGFVLVPTASRSHTGIQLCG